MHKTQETGDANVREGRGMTRSCSQFIFYWKGNKAPSARWVATFFPKHKNRQPLHTQTSELLIRTIWYTSWSVLAILRKGWFVLTNFMRQKHLKNKTPRKLKKNENDGFTADEHTLFSYTDGNVVPPLSPRSPPMLKVAEWPFSQGPSFLWNIFGLPL